MLRDVEWNWPGLNFTGLMFAIPERLNITRRNRN
jgi:hypothetical protein